MSRIGNKTITIPAGVEVTISEGNEVTVKGPKGQLTRQFNPALEIKNEAGIITVSRPNEEKHIKQLHGTTRALLNNMIVGVNTGFSKKLEIVGIGYKAAMEGKTLVLTVGFSHDIRMEIEDGIEIKLDGVNKIEVCGIDKQRVGEVAANIRAKKKPEPYKGKGIRYAGETIKLKEGKSAAA